MSKTHAINVKLEKEFLEALRQKAQETGVPVSEVVRRALQVWLVTGELPKLPEKKGGKHKMK